MVIGCSRRWRQFVLLLKRRFKLKVSNVLFMAVEFLIPILTALIAILFWYFGSSSQEQCFVSFDSDQLSMPDSVPGMEDRMNNFCNIFYSPQTNETDSVMDLVRNQLNGFLASVPLNIEAFATQDEMVSTLMSRANSTQINTCFCNGAGIVFESLTGNELSYKIRLRHEVGQSNSWFTQLTEPSFESGPRVINLYLAEGFLHLQKLVGEAIVQWKAMKEEVPYQPVNVAVRQFPHPAYQTKQFSIDLQGIFAALFVFGFIPSTLITVWALMKEKETGIREYMFLMGLEPWILWSTWYIRQFILLVVSVIIFSILLKEFVFTKTDFSLLLIFFTLFMLSVISYSFFASAWFNSALIAITFVMVTLFASFFLLAILYLQFDSLNFGYKLVLCLYYNTCLGLGFAVLFEQELRGTGVTWTNVASPINADDNFNMAWVLGMLLLETVLYMLVAWYVSAVKPGKYGIHKPLWFPFLLSYWCGTSRQANNNNMRNSMEQGMQEDPEAHEEVESSLQVGICIQNLGMTYSHNIFTCKKGRARAVDKLNLNMYMGQITALLGRNGAGKTTTMSMLTGLYPPTEGTATINDFSILTDMDLIRKNFGFCPQRDTLFYDMTVREHLYFFVCLKGIHDGINGEVSKMIRDLDLYRFRNTLALRLSSGDKRKLSVGIALIGGSKVVILDEPTSGMDPYARRTIWDLLTEYKKDRCIVMSTHFMDEADLLADRIAIMAKGKLFCSGSSHFLKKRYGVGYHLTIMKEAENESARVERLVKSFVLTAEQLTDVGTELTFLLPFHESLNFPELFDQLEESKEELGVHSYGVSVATMKDVFLRLGEETDERLKRTSVRDVSMDATDVQPDSNHNSQPTDSAEPNKGISLWLQQFRAMFLKRVYSSRRRFYRGLIIQFLVPLVTVIISLLLATIIPGVQDNNPPRALLMNNASLDPQNTKLFFAEFGSTVNFSSFSAGDLLVTDYLDISERASGILDTVTPVNDVRDCCKYEHQLLDKFCASRTAEELREACKDNTTFGYHQCIDTCLSCCDATDAMVSSCTRPLSTSLLGKEDFCPSPPSLSLFSNTSAPLDTMNSYVAEYLLKSSLELDPITFFRSYQAGFTIAAQDPIISICDSMGNNCTLFQSLDTEARNSSLPVDTCPVYSVFPNASNGILCTNQPSCFSVEPLSADILQVESCNEFLFGADESPVSKVYPEQLPTPAVTVWYNNAPYHMPAAALNAYQSLRLKQVMGNKNLSLIVINHPLPRNDTTTMTMAVSVAHNNIWLYLYFFIAGGYSFFFAGFLQFTFHEKQSKAKHLQFVNGVGASSYWLASFVWDLLNAFPLVLLITILFAAFQLDGFKWTSLWAMFLVQVLTCWASIPLTYIWSSLFRDFSLSYFLLIFFYIISAMLFIFLELLRRVISVNISIANHIFYLLPAYGLASGLNDIRLNQNLKDLCLSGPSHSMCESSGTFVDNPLTFSYPGVGVVCLCLFVEGCVFFYVTIIIEFYPKLKHLCAGNGNARPACSYLAAPSIYPGAATDILTERARVMGERNSEDAIIFKDLVKIYPSRSLPAKKALCGITLGIHRGECFGLLGVNGAGKTTIFKILTGDIPMTSGISIIGGYDITKSKNVCSFNMHARRIGYCPQYDALIDHLTGRELLLMFARLRGIPEHQIKEVVDKEIIRLDLKNEANKRCGSYSTGSRRKLSTAIALVGDPPIILLDEPTTGVDPISRRFLWKVLAELVHEGRTIILSSQSMEECEALCNRVAIMYNGEIKCLGKTQDIKNKFGLRYTLHAKVKPNLIPQSEQVEEVAVGSIPLRDLSRGTFTDDDKQASFASVDPAQSVSAPGKEPEVISLARHDIKSLRTFIENTFEKVFLMDEYEDAITYQLPRDKQKLSTIFKTMEANKKRLGIIEYTVGYTTLEEVFINFSKDIDEECTMN